MVIAIPVVVDVARLSKRDQQKLMVHGRGEQESEDDDDGMVAPVAAVSKKHCTYIIFVIQNLRETVLARLEDGRNVEVDAFPSP